MTDPAYWEAIQRLQNQENRPPLTIRQRLEAIRDAACEEYQSPDLVSNPELIRRIYGNAVAALKALDEAARPGSWTEYRAVYDPDPAPPTENT